MSTVTVQAPDGPTLEVEGGGQTWRVAGGGTLDVPREVAHALVASGKGFHLVGGWSIAGDGTRTPILAPFDVTIRVA